MEIKKKMTMSEAGKLGAIASLKTSKENKEKRIQLYNCNPKKCLQCNSIIEYENKNNKFCNRSCAAKTNNVLYPKKELTPQYFIRKTREELSNIRLEVYNNNPKKCVGCDCILEYKKRYNVYCTRACGAKSTNNFHSKIEKNEQNYNIRNGIKVNNCLNCDQMCSHKYCNFQCQQDYQWFKRKEEILNSGKFDDAITYNSKIARRFFFERDGNQCQICKLTEWLGKPIGLVLDHINGDPYNNMIINLRLICRNCDAQTETFGSKNYGNGRAKRRERYKQGKSY